MFLSFLIILVLSLCSRFGSTTIVGASVVSAGRRPVHEVWAVHQRPPHPASGAFKRREYQRCVQSFISVVYRAGISSFSSDTFSSFRQPNFPCGTLPDTEKYEREVHPSLSLTLTLRAALGAAPLQGCSWRQHVIQSNQSGSG